jgi:pimeloyl-ACP methyl ester carboxylesterase
MTPSFSVALSSTPSLALLSIEPLRAALEYASMLFMNKAAMPPGDGHPVVIFPGLAADQRSLHPLKEFCEQLGYATCDWGRGFNTGPQGDVDAWIDELARHVNELVPPSGQSMSLIGWSLGGIYAREVAKKLPGRVRQVITIGTPFAGSGEQTNVSWIYRLLNGKQPRLDNALAARLRTPPDVPTTSIFSRSDGIVAWQACCDEGGADHTENIEVDGSHCGLGWNLEVLAVIADRLHQPPRAWQPYTRSLASGGMPGELARFAIRERKYSI